jgi:hypothetical protein
MRFAPAALPSDAVVAVAGPDVIIRPVTAELFDAYRDRSRALRFQDRVVVDGALVEAAPTAPVTTNKVIISFDYCVVSAERNWYTQAFLTDRWWVPLKAKGERTNPANIGSIPWLPVAVVIIKGLEIEASWAADDIATAAGAMSFGPFEVSGGVVAGKLSHPGLQIVGWLLQRMPDLPPLDSPVLPPAA